MKSDDLIEKLSADAARVPPHFLERKFAVSLATGVGAALIALYLIFGFRPDLGSAIFTAPFQIKAFYSIATGIAAASIGVGLLRPTGKLKAQDFIAAAPAIIVAVIAGRELLNAQESDWPLLVFGKSSLFCVCVISVLSAPILASLFIAARRAAPAHFLATGAMLGVAAGAFGAFVYALFCTESSACFIFVWYSAGILLIAALGALLGPRLLRW